MTELHRRICEKQHSWLKFEKWTISSVSLTKWLLGVLSANSMAMSHWMKAKDGSCEAAISGCNHTFSAYMLKLIKFSLVKCEMDFMQMSRKHLAY